MNLLQTGIVGVLWFASYLSYAQTSVTDNILKVGNPAPSLHAAQWVKGKPVKEFKKGHVYIVDFGFIGCVPCMEGWPKLSDIQKEYKNSVTIVAIMTFSQSFQVKKYLEKMGDRMGLKVAVDFREPIAPNKKDWVLNRLWVKATGKALGKNSMPYPTIYFIDKEGNIAFIGDSGTDVRYVINRLVNQGFDRKNLIRKEQQQKLKRQELLNEYFSEKDKDHINALKKVDELIKMFPDKITYKGYKFGLLLKINEQLAYPYGKTVLDSYPWEKMNNAWSLAKNWSELIKKEIRNGNLKSPDYNLAIAMCLTSAKFSKDTYLEALSYEKAAAFYFMQGHPEKGEDLMLKAIDIAPEPGQKKRFRKMLEKHRKSY